MSEIQNPIIEVDPSSPIAAAESVEMLAVLAGHEAPAVQQKVERFFPSVGSMYAHRQSEHTAHLSARGAQFYRVFRDRLAEAVALASCGDGRTSPRLAGLHAW